MRVKGGHQERRWGWSERWTWAIRGSFPPILSLEYTLHSTHIFHSNRDFCYWDHLDWTPLKPLYKLLRFWEQVQRSTYLTVAQDKPSTFVLLFIKLATLLWSLFARCVQVQFHILPGELQRFWTNIKVSFLCDFYEQIEKLKCKTWVTQQRSLKLVEQQSILTFIINNPWAQIGSEVNIIQGHNCALVFFSKMLFKVIHIEVICMKIDDDSSFHCMWKKWLMSAL